MIDDLWYKNGIIYCLSVGTYMDANGDGIGDFKGLLRRLDYLHGLGITAIWLMPFQPSPGKDDGYDISAGRSKLSSIREEELPDNLRALKPAQRSEEVDKQMNQRKALNEKLSALVAKRDKYVADQRAKAPPKASSFDRVVEDTLKAQIKR